MCGVNLENLAYAIPIKTKISPFFTNYDYNSVIEELCSKESLAINTTENTRRLKELHEQLKRDTEFINLTIGHYYNKRHKDVPP